MVRPGQYMHFKGREYTVILVARRHEHSVCEYDVVYSTRELCNPQIVFTRPLNRDSRDEASWNDMVEWPDGIVRKRFMSFEELADERSHG